MPRAPYDHLRLHVKPVAGSVNYTLLRTLTMSTTSRANLEKSLKWVEDATFYKQFNLPPFRRYPARFSEEDTQALISAHKFVDADPRCSVKGFCVPEWDRERKRPIFWPDINEAIDKSLLIPGIIPLKPAVRKASSLSNWSVQFDFASWYDQLPLGSGVPSFFSFDGRKCLASLPMGFRPSADVAQSVTAAIADFPLPEGVNVTV